MILGNVVYYLLEGKVCINSISVFKEQKRNIIQKWGGVFYCLLNKTGLTTLINSNGFVLLSLSNTPFPDATVSPEIAEIVTL